MNFSYRNPILLILIGLTAFFIQDVMPLNKNVPFRVIWNSPTHVCKSRYNVILNLDKWGIESNVNQTWQNATVTLFYATVIGLWAFINNNGTRVNGGIPERMNITAHANETIADIQRVMKNTNFSGLAVIDMEFYTPLWQLMMDPVYQIYIDESIDYFKTQMNTSGLDDTAIRLGARQNYESVIKNMMILTLRVAKQNRPYALWGYYAFPKCAPSLVSYQCDIVQNNQAISWLYEASTALYPAFYINRIGDPLYHARTRQLIQLMNEAQRISASRINGPIPVYLYVRYAYVKENKTLLDYFDLKNIFAQAVDMAQDGIVFWGDYADFGNCKALSTHMEKLIGPLVKQSIDFANVCSQQVCTGNGRCIRKEFLDPQNPPSINMDSFYRFNIYKKRILDNMGNLTDSYSCVCYSGWSGNDCKITTM